MTFIPVKKTIGIALAITNFSGVPAVSAPTQSIECEIVKMKSVFNIDGNTERDSISGAQLKKIASTFPLDCQTTKYTYGNGVLDMVDAPAKCASYLPDNNISGLSMFPVEYKVWGKKIKFRKKLKILDPEFGSLNVSFSGTYDTEKMIFQHAAKATLTGESDSFSWSKILHCDLLG